MNVPNTLSLIRVLLVPFFMAAALFMQGIPLWGKIVPALLFGLASFTDFLDGKIARKYNLVTDFGKFIDPLADKFMVFGALITILVIDPEIAPVFVWVAAVVMLRELAITSLRLVVAGKEGLVIAASFFGKLKTVSQIAAILLILLEPLFTGVAFVFEIRIVSYVAMALMAVTTVASGLDYMKAYMPLVDTNK
ncbi:MAG: CDP-diacylglycerol--glycerol-3-phosphate 3-phosphatidyltransferase [Clostridia bacterium]|nr:CDP-diacylglycerol--glycerol-3-phosphate 3-phosphatidyltransferase [Clostridia bacterium]